MKNQNLDTLNSGYPISKTRIYQIYQGMKQRCYNPNNDAFSHYGGRGISICREWLGENGLQNFISWSLNNGYEENLTIDRINNNGNYEPSNCQWVTRSYNSAKGKSKIEDFESNPNSVGKVIQKLMISKNITHEALAKRLGIQSQSFTNKICRGDMSIQDFSKILDELGFEIFINIPEKDTLIKI